MGCDRGSERPRRVRIPIVSAASTQSGYIDELLRTMGVSATTAQHTQDLILRPVSVTLVAVTCWIAAHFGSRLIRKALGRYSERVKHAGDPNQALRIDTVSRIVANSWRVGVWLLGIVTMLSIIGINLTPFLAGATVIGATIGFGAQSLVRDFLSGFLMLLEDQFRLGDVITINDLTGTVEEVSLRVTRLRSADGVGWYIPNGQILRLGNTSRHWSRALVHVLVRSNAPIGEALTIIAAAAQDVATREDLAPLLSSKPNVLGVTNVASTGLTIDVEVRTRPGEDDRVARALREGILDALGTTDLLALTDSE